ncbi:hypothetical protein Rsub_05993 [Raphidocelis subcapitata]|uniref:Phosphoglycerate mutase n=1 Tax=Raphidocelis subcapitata TaxID=307507 RepID=A0A2V0P057_9CHLO|nr:hypothetical protein Rsub_05993 [Raphidocelis subcapitata]|eukprot:GBF93261.1 hypothetical protein Rsub_05993 [Raphidocelis subcapitata]
MPRPADPRAPTDRPYATAGSALNPSPLRWRDADSAADDDGDAGAAGAASSSSDGWEAGDAWPPAAPQPRGAGAAAHGQLPLRDKVIVVLRHGASTWNEQGRIQGNTDESELTAAGRAQALRAREALCEIGFDGCYCSPHTRARQTAELVWPQGAQVLESLSECDLGWFQGKTNDELALHHPDQYRVWRDAPERFCLEGRYPVRDAFRQARRAAIDIANGAVSMLRSHPRGLSLSALNLTSHLAHGDVRYGLPRGSRNDGLAAEGG